MTARPEMAHDLGRFVEGLMCFSRVSYSDNSNEAPFGD
jgi:hypothetical protein